MSWLWASFPGRGAGNADGPRQLTQVGVSNEPQKRDEVGCRGLWLCDWGRREGRWHNFYPNFCHIFIHRSLCMNIVFSHTQREAILWYFWRFAVCCKHCLSGPLLVNTAHPSAEWICIICAAVKPISWFEVNKQDLKKKERFTQLSSCCSWRTLLPPGGDSVFFRLSFATLFCGNINISKSFHLNEKVCDRGAQSTQPPQKCSSGLKGQFMLWESLRCAETINNILLFFTKPFVPLSFQNNRQYLICLREITFPLP